MKTSTRILDKATRLMVFWLMVFWPSACSTSPSSPPGEFVYVTVLDGNFEVFLTQTDDTTQHNLTNNAGLDYRPAWSVDGKQVLFYSNRTGNFDVYVMDDTGSNVRNLSNHPARDINPVAGPDGRIAFVSDRDGDRELYLMEADGSNVRQLPDNEHLDDTPAWSPDGAALAYSSSPAGNSDGDIYILTVATGETRLLVARQGYDSSPAWSPSGLQIAFNGTVAEDTVSLFLVNSDGTGLRRLPNQAADERHPRWSQDGSWLLYTASMHDSSSINTDVWLLEVDGTVRQALVTGPHRQEFGVWRPAR